MITIDPDKCFECGRPKHTDHHVVPEPLGGTKTVPVCEYCNHKIHGEGGDKGLTLPNIKKNLRRLGFRTEGRLPYGRDIVKKDGKGKVTVPNIKELEAIADMFLLRMRGNTFKQIAAHLNQKGTFTKENLPWWPQSVHGIMYPAKHKKENQDIVAEAKTIYLQRLGGEYNETG